MPRVIESILPSFVVKEDAEKWQRLMRFLDTSCDKCFLNHVCKRGSICEDIKDAVSKNKEAIENAGR